MKKWLVVGIDPGLDGAVARLSMTGGNLVVDTPTVSVGGGRRAYHYAQMALILRDYVTGVDPDLVLVVLEKQQAFPGQGVSSTFATGFGYGLWVGICTTLGVPFEEVRPDRWKRIMLNGVREKGKGPSLAKARMLFPGLASDRLLRAKDHGRAEALLLAEYGRRLYE